MKTRLFCILVALTLARVGQSQWRLDVHVELPNITQVSSDGNQYVYFATKSGIVHRYGLNGDYHQVFSPTRIGAVKQMDVISQFKLLLFYEQYQEYVVLDRYLTRPTYYRLDRYPIGFASTMAVDRQNRVWVLDAGGYLLLRLDEIQGSISETMSLAKLFEQRDVEVQDLKFMDGYLYLVTAQNGLYVLDNFGNFISHIDVPVSANFGFYQGNYYYQVENHLYMIDLTNGQKTMVELPMADGVVGLYVGEFVVMVSSKGFDIYKYLRTNK